MRCSLLAALLMALLAAGPAPAQESGPPGNPGPVQAAPKEPVKPKIKRARRPAQIKAASAPAASRVPVPTPKPDAAQAKSEKTAAKSKPANAKADPASEAIAAIPVGERARIRAALAWAGDLSGAPHGDDAFTAAVKSFQKRNNAKVTGELTPDQRALLVAAAHNHESDFGWSVVADPATGVRVGLPTKMVPRAQDVPHGTRWSSAHGEVQIETFRFKQPGLKLADLFERQKTEPVNRKVGNSTLHDDNFLISGTQGLKYFSVRAQMRDGEIRGVTLMYDQAWEGIVAPVTGAIVSTFAPFPDRGTPYAALAKPVEYGTGLVVSRNGYIITARRLAEGCQIIVVPGLGDAERVAVNESEDMALLRVYGRSKLTALALSAEPPKAADLTLVGIPDPREQGGNRKLSEIKARLANGNAIELRQSIPVAGLAGAAVIDTRGRVVGMMAMRGAMLASMTAAAAPPVRLVGATAIRNFLAARNVPLPAPPEGNVRDAVARVICVRK